LGFIADWHYQGFQQQPDSEIIGMTQDLYGEKEKMAQMQRQLAQKCAEWAIRPYENFKAMCEDPELDALIIGSINPYHYEQIIQGLASGKHLLVEKPVVTDVAQLEVIEKKAQENQRIVFPAHNFVYRDVVQQARAKLNSGALGKIVYASFMSSHTISEAHANGWRGKLAFSAGGALMDSGHHLVYQSIYLMGMPAKIQAFSSNLVLKQMEGEDIAQVNLLYPDGSLGTIMQSWTSGHGQAIDGIKLVGTDGSITISEVDYADTFCQQARHFIDTVMHGQKPLSDLNDARKSLYMIEHAYASVRSNQVIEL